MLKVNPLKDYGDIRGARYDFEKAGDILPKHVHNKDNVHITIVAKGRIKIYSHDWSIEASAGQLVDFRPNEPHEFMALEDGTRIFNIIKKLGGAQPIAYDGVLDQTPPEAQIDP
jgi:quercetin dioxygenase-like cupin family protein